jgi:hypothetical protein
MLLPAFRDHSKDCRDRNRNSSHFLLRVRFARFVAGGLVCSVACGANRDAGCAWPIEFTITAFSKRDSATPCDLS